MKDLWLFGNSTKISRVYPYLTDPTSIFYKFFKFEVNFTFYAAHVSMLAIELTKVVPILVQSGMYPFMPLNSCEI